MEMERSGGHGFPISEFRENDGRYSAEEVKLDAFELRKVLCVDLPDLIEEIVEHRLHAFVSRYLHLYNTAIDAKIHHAVAIAACVALDLKGSSPELGLLRDALEWSTVLRLYRSVINIARNEQGRRSAACVDLEDFLGQKLRVANGSDVDLESLTSRYWNPERFQRLFAFALQLSTRAEELSSARPPDGYIFRTETAGSWLRRYFSYDAADDAEVVRPVEFTARSSSQTLLAEVRKRVESSLSLHAVQDYTRTSDPHFLEKIVDLLIQNLEFTLAHIALDFGKHDHYAATMNIPDPRDYPRNHDEESISEAIKAEIDRANVSDRFDVRKTVFDADFDPIRTLNERSAALYLATVRPADVLERHSMPAPKRKGRSNVSFVGRRRRYARGHRDGPF